MPSIEEVKKLAEHLPDAIRKVVEEVIEGYLFVKPFLLFIPESGRGKIANNFGHQIVKVFKIAGWDSGPKREYVKDVLIGLFDLDEDWIPKWPLDPVD